MDDLRSALVALDDGAVVRFYIAEVGLEGARLRNLVEVAHQHISGKATVDELRAAYYAFNNDPALLILACPDATKVSHLKRFVEAVASSLDRGRASEGKQTTPQPQ